MRARYSAHSVKASAQYVRCGLRDHYALAPMRSPDNPTRSELDALRLRALGSRIRQRRRALEPSVTQEDLAARAGISRPELSRIEGGTARPTVPMIYSLADALGCHIRDLFDEG